MMAVAHVCCPPAACGPLRKTTARPSRSCVTVAALPRAPPAGGRERSPSPSPARSARASPPSPARTPVVAGAAGALALALPALHPGLAEAAAVWGSPVSSQYWPSMGLGGAGVLATVLLTSRFLMSYFPELEKRARKPRAARRGMRWMRLLTVADPVLDPISRGFFRQTEPGDLNYGAVALLAVCSAVLTTLLGDGGLMVSQVPDLGTLQMLRYLCYVQHMLLLPMWVFVVFRYFLLL